MEECEEHDENLPLTVALAALLEGEKKILLMIMLLGIIFFTSTVAIQLAVLS